MSFRRRNGEMPKQNSLARRALHTVRPARHHIRHRRAWPHGLGPQRSHHINLQFYLSFFSRINRSSLAGNTANDTPTTSGPQVDCIGTCSLRACNARVCTRPSAILTTLVSPRCGNTSCSSWQLSSSLSPVPSESLVTPYPLANTVHTPASPRLSVPGTMMSDVH